MKKILLFTIMMTTAAALSQNVLTPELLWQLGRVSAVGMSVDGKSIIYKVSTPSVDENKSTSKYYSINLSGGAAAEIDNHEQLIKDKNLSPYGNNVVYHEEVKVEKVAGSDFYPELKKSGVQIYDGLDYRHWDSWHEGKYNHVFFKPVGAKKGTDIMKGQRYDSPQKPFGGDEDYVWSPDGKSILYVVKQKSGTDYANSTNTDILEYNIETGTTVNRTASNPGYDTNPQFSPFGALTYLQMARDGYEADKNDLIMQRNGENINLTAGWDGTVDSFKWSDKGDKIYFIAPVGGTKQLFEVKAPGKAPAKNAMKQLTDGVFDVTGIIGFSGDRVLVTRTDMNHAAEIYSYDLKRKTWKQLSHVNDDIYSRLTLSKVEKRMVTTTDGKQMTVWVILPPNFDPSKKYPTLLYCQGGPQSPLTQSYSFRWNFSLMSAQGYIVVAPNRRGMSGHGVEWNEKISGDWGGQVMDDYLSAIDDVAKEPYVDNKRLGCVGASYGGYSVFYLAGIHKNRFKTFIAHDGVFNLQSMYGTTEEVFFTHWENGGAYWEADNAAAQKSYKDFNPINRVGQWDTPILIIQGGKDYRVPIGQSLEAFQAAQLRGIKSRLLYFPDENHWVLQPQNAIIWQREFYRWLTETL